MSLPPFISRKEVQRRLLLVFPEGTPSRVYCTREMAASTVFAALYVGAVEGSGRYISPKHVYKMSGAQAALRSDAAPYRVRDGGRATRHKVPRTAVVRRQLARAHPRRDFAQRAPRGRRGIDRKDLATTSSKPRYALTAAFAELFDPSLTGDALRAAMADWRQTHLAPAALKRVALMRAGVLEESH